MYTSIFNAEIDQNTNFDKFQLLYKFDGIYHGLPMPGEEITFTALHGRKSTLTTNFLATAEAYFVCYIGPNFQIYLIYAFIGCP